MFSELKKLESVYFSTDFNVSKDFYYPIFKSAVVFNRTSAYFSSKVLALFSDGLEYFGKAGHVYRMILSNDIPFEDLEQIKKGYSLRDTLVTEQIDRLREELTLEEERKLSNLAYYVAKGYVEIKIAYKTEGIFHDKCGIAIDEAGNMLSFRGSINETEAAITRNYESFTLTCSWEDSPTGFYTKGIKKSLEEFELLWNNKKPGLIVLPVEKAVIEEIKKHDRGKVISTVDELLKDYAILDFDDSLMLKVNFDSIELLENKFFFKVYIKPHIKRIYDNIVYFNKDLVYSDFIEISKTLEKYIPTLGYKYIESKQLKALIEEKNQYIDSKRKIGIELKTDDTKLSGKYNEFKKTVQSKMVRKLREKQMKDAFFMYAMKKSGNFSVPGSGKTTSALAVYAFLKTHSLVDNIVMIGPKNAFGSWIDEFQACFGEKENLHYFSIQDDLAFKTKTQKRITLQFDSHQYNLFLFNYQSLSGYLDQIVNLVNNKTLLIIDEVHKVKAIDGEWAKCVLEISKQASYIIAMTGTPIPNSYVDIYNFLQILFHDEYRSFFGFDISYLKHAGPNQIAYINNKIQPFFCRTTKEQLLVPPANPDIEEVVNVTEEEQRLYQIISKQYSNNSFTLLIRLMQMESNPKMLLSSIDYNEVEELVDEYTINSNNEFIEYSEEIKNLIKSIQLTSKMKRCIEKTMKLVHENKKVIIWCIFKESIHLLSSELNRYGIKTKCIMGEIELNQRLSIINDFRNGEFDVLITNPHTLAESVSLHQVCHDAIYFEYSYNLVHLLQSKDRIHRLGLTEEQYTQYYFMENYYSNNNSKISLDKNIYNRLKQKEQIMLNAIDKQVLEPVYSSEEDLKYIFKGIL